MSRSHLFSRLRKLANQSLQSEVDLPRRHFLQGLAVGATSLALAPLISCTSKEFSNQKNSTQIAIVGAGLAGTSCAYQLAKAGIPADLYEASTRIGGRTFSLRNHFADGQTAELGGELIDSNHQAVFRLSKELGLEIDDCRLGAKDSDHFIVAGEILSESWILDNFRPLAKSILATRNLADANPEYFTKLDFQSISEWLDAHTDVDFRIKQLLKNAYTGEFGLEADKQSVISLLYFIDPENQKEFKIFGESDERFHIRNGNDQMALRMASRLIREPILGHYLLKIKQSGAGYQLSFEASQSTKEIQYDLVVLAIPFTMLRNVDLNNSGFAPDKLTLIKTLGYGTNAKIMAGFKNRPWLKHTDNFSIIADDPIQTVWETSRGQPGRSGILTNFLGGDRGFNSFTGTALEQFKISLGKLETNFSGLTESFIPEKTVRMHWPSHPFAFGSYACYLPGQASKAGLEARTEGNVFFCGEHCSEEFQGFMEGAIQTGELVASKIIRKIS